MQAGNPSTTLGDRGSRRGSLGLVGGSLLTLAMLAGVGVWLIAAHGGGSNAARVPPRPAVAAPVAVAAQPAVAQPAETFTYYLVGSQEEAVALRDAIQHEVAAPDLKPGPYDVVVAGSPEEQALALQEIHSEQQMLSGSGSPSLRIIDLRAQTTSAMLGTYPPESGGGEGPK